MPFQVSTQKCFTEQFMYVRTSTKRERILYIFEEIKKVCGGNGLKSESDE